jgi:Ca2+:H+ antiporter
LFEVSARRHGIAKSTNIWRIAPLAALAIAIATLPFAGRAGGGAAVAIALLQLAALFAAVFASVHHADVIAHRTGEPYGTLVLTAAVTVIEVALILSVMLAGDGSATLARDTVLAVVMVVCNGLVGLCLVVGGLRYGEQDFQVPGASAYLVVLMPLATLTLILPSFTVSVPGPYFSSVQLVFVSIATLLLYAVFLYVQTVRHRDYFLSDSGAIDDDEAHLPPPPQVFWSSVALLLVALVAVVLLSKSLGMPLKSLVRALGAPIAAVGLFVAMLVLLPEAIAAVRSARGNDLQKSLNLALGSSLATIGLTIPAVGALSVLAGTPIALGLEPRDIVLVVLTFAVSIVTFAAGRTNILPGFVHLVLFGTFVFVIFAP